MKLVKVGVALGFLLCAVCANGEEKKICINEAEQERRLGIIENYSEKTFGSMEGTIGALVGGILGSKIDGGNDATMVLGTFLGNKMGNDVKRKRDKNSTVCYIVVQESTV